MLPAVEAGSLNHWTTGEVLGLLLKTQLYSAGNSTASSFQVPLVTADGPFYTSTLNWLTY